MQVSVTITPQAKGAEPKERHITLKDDVAIDEFVGKLRTILQGVAHSDERARKSEVPM